MARDTSPLLQLDKISKSYGSLEILKAVDLHLHPGEIVAITGPSGSGKSTLLHICGLMDHPTSGEMIIDQHSLSRLSESQWAEVRLNKIGFVFQFHHLLPDFNVLENVLIPSRIAGDDMISSEKKAKEVLNRLGLSNRMGHRPSELSGGEQQRAAFARALIRNPKILLCDEPTGNLDSDTAQSVSQMMWKESRQEGMGVIVVTHNDVVSDQADRKLRLVEGKFFKP